MHNSLLEVQELSKHFGGLKALNKCSFYVKKGMITSLIGPNGAGKSTAFNVINGFLKPDHGEVFFKGVKITGWEPHKVAAMGVSRTFQAPKLFKNLTIQENLLLAMRKKDHRLLTSFLAPRKPSKAEAELMRNTLAEVGLDESLEVKASDLSYGQQRLLEITRALLKPHDILLMDEPTAGVNPKLRSSLKGLLRRLKSQGKTIFLIEHDMEFVMDLSDEVIVLDHGKKLVADVPEKVKNNPAVLEAYLGD